MCNISISRYFYTYRTISKFKIAFPYADKINIELQNFLMIHQIIELDVNLLKGIATD